MWQAMLRVATRLDSAGQHDLADAMERLAAKLPFHVPTEVVRGIREAIPDEFDAWIEGLGKRAFDVTKIDPTIHPSIEMPGGFYSWTARRMHPDVVKDPAMRAQLEPLYKDVTNYYGIASRGEQKRGFDPSRGFVPGYSKYDTPSGVPAEGPSTAGTPPRRPAPRPTPGPPPPGAGTAPPPPDPTPGPRTSWSTPPPEPTPGPRPSEGTPPPEGPRREYNPPPPGPPPPGTAYRQGPPPEPERTTWQKIPWWAKWGPIGYMGYQVLRPKDERRSTNVTPPQPVLHDPRQDYQDVPYNPYYGR